jgi:hypothetical protein
MDWTTKLLLAENRTPSIPSSKRTMIWAILDVCAIRFKLGILFHGLIDSTFKLGESPFLGNINLYTTEISDCNLKFMHKENTFWRPGNLNLARRRDSMTAALYLSEERMLMMGCPMFTRATVPWGLPKAPLIPVWSLKLRKHL